MIARPIAYYVHHHGSGHASRALAIAEQMSHPIVFITCDLQFETDLPHASVRYVEADFGKEDVDYASTSSQATHYTPVPSSLYMHRAKSLVDTFESLNPSLLVVDVSVEVALQARLCGIPCIFVRQHGDRNDLAHQIAYCDSVGLLAPFPSEFEQPSTASSIIEKTQYTSIFSRFAGRAIESKQEARMKLSVSENEKVVLVATGSGGNKFNLEKFVELAKSLPDMVFFLLGIINKEPDIALTTNLRQVGWVNDPSPFFAAADCFVTSAGHNSVMEGATFRLPLVVVPEQRHFDEQLAKAAILENLDLAEVVECWDAPIREWHSAIRRACSANKERWDYYLQGDGAQQAADFIQNTSIEMRSRARGLAQHSIS